jgi:glycosyltransferase 2 family protein
MSLRRALARLQPLFIVVAFALLGVLLRSQWNVLRTHDWRLRPEWLAASGAAVVIGWLIEIRMWQRLLGHLGGRLAYWTSVRIWFISAIVRYIPGNIWQALSLTVRCGEHGIRAEATLASLTLFQIVHTLAIGPIVAVYLATWGRDGPLASRLGTTSAWWAVGVVCPIALFVASPHTLLAVANRALRKLGREPLPLDLSAIQLLRSLATSFVAWMFFCTGFVAFVAAVTSSNRQSFWTAAPHLATAYPVAFAGGMLSIVTPSGLGVREGLLFFLLSPILGGANAIVVALGMRAWEVALDAAVSGLALGAKREKLRSAI